MLKILQYLTQNLSVDILTKEGVVIYVDFIH